MTPKQGKESEVLMQICEICQNTRKKILKTLDIRMLAPQILTDARKKACECIRISYIWGCLLLVYSGNLSAENK